MADVTGTNGNDTLTFLGQIGQLTVTIENAYTGETIVIDELKNINTASYEGLAGIDTLLMSNYGDALFLEDSFGNTLISGIERFIAGDGGDVIVLSSTHITLGSTFIDGGAGDDVIWANAGADTINGFDGNDILDGGPGDDSILGGNGHDQVYGGNGHDSLRGDGGDDILAGNAGNDTLRGGSGNDTYLYNVGDGADTIIDSDGGALVLGAGLSITSLSYSFSGNNLVIDTGGTGTNTITLQSFTSIPSGSFEISFADGGHYTVETLLYNIAPNASADSFSGFEDSAITANLLADNGNGADSDANGDNLTVQAANFTTANGGTVTILANGDMTYTPAANYFGNDSFSYTVTDGNGGAASGTVSLTLASVNDGPVASDDSFTGNEDSVVSGALLADNGNGADNDIDGDTLSVQAASFITANGGTVTINSDGTFSYNPAANFYGMDSFSYNLSDGAGGSDIGTVTVTLAEVNDAPAAFNDSFAGQAGQDITGNLLADNGNGADSDVDGDVLNVQPATLTTAGGNTVIINADGTFVYSAAASFSGADSFAYTALDGRGGSAEATASFTIAAIPPGGIYGTEGNDVISGGNHDQTIYGLGGADILEGGNATDTLYGGTGSDMLAGNNGVDALHGDDGNDTLSGGNGDDALDGGSGADWLMGGRGDDTLFYSSDEVWTSGYGAWNVGSVNIAGTNQIVSIAGYNGTNDIYDGGQGYDTLVMGDGNDSLFLHDDYGARPDGSGTGARLSGIEQFDAGAGNDVIDLTSPDFDYDIDTLMHGGDGNDVLWSSIGNDRLYGDDGNDNLFGGGGDDLLYGGGGDDVLYYAEDSVWSACFGALNVGSPGNAGTSEFVSINGMHRSYDYFDGGDGHDTLKLGNGNDALFLDDSYSPNPQGLGARIAGIEVIDGRGGDDVIDLTSADYAYGNVTLIGGKGNDVLWSSSGDDILYGGLGTDILYGGTGSDIFLYKALSDAGDTIQDFQTGIGGDVLNISDILIGFDEAQDDINAFLHLVESGGKTQVQVNVDGMGTDFKILATITNDLGGVTVADLLGDGNLAVHQSISV